MSNQPIVIRPEDVAGQFDNHGKRIPRPMNAFMLYANEMRGQLKKMSPKASNKEISVRLGDMWSKLSPEKKDVFYKRAKIAEREHMAKYPEYRYCPSVSKVIKAMRKQEAEQRKMWMKSNEALERSSHTPSPHTIPDSKKRQILAGSVYSKVSAPTQYHIQKPGLDPAYKYLESNTAASSYILTDVSRSQCPVGQPIRPGQPLRSTALTNQQQMSPDTLTRPSYQFVAEEDPNHVCTLVRPHKKENRSQSDTPFDDHLLFTDPSLYETECQQAVANITSPDIKPVLESSHLTTQSVLSHSLTDNTSQTESDYVMIPCDINIARMLGWPVHLLQRISTSALESLREEAIMDSNSEVFDSIFPALNSDQMEEPPLNQLVSSTILQPGVDEDLSESPGPSSVREELRPAEHCLDPCYSTSPTLQIQLTSQETLEKQSSFTPAIQSSLALCPMDNEFSVFPSSDSSDNELDSIDTSSMSATFGHLDSPSMAAYRTHSQCTNSQTTECY